MRRVAPFVLISALAGLATSPAAGQAPPDAWTYCQHLAAQAVAYQGQMQRSGRTAQDLKRRLAEVPAEQMALSIWSPRTLGSVIDYVARNPRQGPVSLQVAVVRACEAQVPESAQVRVGVQRRFCGELSERAYLVAGERDRGVTVERALEEAELRTRPQFRDDAAAVVLLVYDLRGRTPQQVAREVLAGCVRAGEVELR